VNLIAHAWEALHAILRRPLVRRGLAPIFCAWLLLWLVSAQSWWQEIGRLEFDILTVTTAPRSQQLPIIIVGIDDLSMQQLDVRWPWPMELHARLVDQLTAAGAAVIMFDVVFDREDANKTFPQFAASLSRSGNVILAASTAYQETRFGAFWLRSDPIEPLAKSAAIVGLANVELDPDLVPRQQPENDNSLWREVIRTLARQVPDLGADLSSVPNRRIRYLGPDQTFTYVPYFQALDPAANFAPGAFEGALVLVGRTTVAASDVGFAQQDMFITPFTRFTQRLMPGVEIHANLIEGALTGKFIDQAPNNWGWGLIILCSFLALGVTVRFNPLWSTIGLIAIIALVAGSIWALFDRQQMWLAGHPAVAAATLIFFWQGLASVLREREQRQAIRNTFALYVPEGVVSELISHPEKISLGGEQKELTLLFSDLAGFTSVSEALEPPEVATLLNEYFKDMSEVIFRHRGTIDKFIGDAIMAFWNAPVDDPGHALNGVQAARDMLIALGTVSARLQARGLPPIDMRIGIHTGPAVVGNLGSPTRFSYTAIGDSVNLASRLEGVNKYYGTRLLISGDTVARLGQHAAELALRPVDRVRVKGKSEAVDLYTLCLHPELRERQLSAFATYQRGEWAEALRCFETLLADAPDDKLAQTYIDRLKHFIAQPPANWDGVMTMEAK
jgi:adenylate cyclase